MLHTRLFFHLPVSSPYICRGSYTKENFRTELNGGMTWKSVCTKKYFLVVVTGMAGVVGMA